MFTLLSNLQSSRAGGHSSRVSGQEHAKHDIHIVVRSRINADWKWKICCYVVYIFLKTIYCHWRKPRHWRRLPTPNYTRTLIIIISAQQLYKCVDDWRACWDAKLLSLMGFFLQIKLVKKKLCWWKWFQRDMKMLRSIHSTITLRRRWTNCTHTRTHSRRHSRTHTRTHAHTRTHTHANTAHTLSLSHACCDIHITHWLVHDHLKVHTPHAHTNIMVLLWTITDIVFKIVDIINIVIILLACAITHLSSCSRRIVQINEAIVTKYTI